MKKTIHSWKNTGKDHPAVGSAIELTFVDNTKLVVWEEAFFDQISGYRPGIDLTGYQIDIEEIYYDIV